MSRNIIETIFDTVTETISQAVEAVIGLFDFIKRKVGEFINPWEVDTEYKPSEADKEAIQKSKELLVQHLGSSPFERLLALQPLDRAKCLEGLLNDVAAAYDIEITQLVFEEFPPAMCGFYDFETRNIHINAAHLAANDVEKMKEVLDTLFHECRHAVQHSAIFEPERYRIDPETVHRWRMNFRNYIDPAWDREGYWKQPVEFDARNFAGSIVSDLE